MKFAFFIIFLIITNFCYAKEKITLNATTSSYAPFVFKNNKSEIIGIDVDLIKNVFGNLGYEVNFSTQPWKKAYLDAKNGIYDILILTEKTPEREKLFYFSEPTFLLKTVFYKRKSRDISFASLKYNHSLRVGIGNEFIYEKKIQYYIDNNKFKKYVIYGDNINIQGLLKTAFSQIDFYICPKINCDFIIKNYKSKIKELAKLDSTDPKTGEYSELHLAFPKILENSRQLCLDFNREFLKFKETTQFQSILKTYEQDFVVNSSKDNSKFNKTAAISDNILK